MREDGEGEEAGRAGRHAGGAHLTTGRVRIDHQQQRGAQEQKADRAVGLHGDQAGEDALERVGAKGPAQQHGRAEQHAKESGHAGSRLEA